MTNDQIHDFRDELLSPDELNALFHLGDKEYRAIQVLYNKGYVEYMYENTKLISKTDVARHLGVSILPDKFLSLEEAADYLDMSPSSVKKLSSKEHALPFYQLIREKGSYLLFTKEDLDHARKHLFQGTLIRNGTYFAKVYQMITMRSMISSLLHLAGTHHVISDRDQDVVNRVLRGERLKDIGKSYGLTDAWAQLRFQTMRHLIVRAPAVFAAMKKHIKALIHERAILRSQNKILLNEIEVLKKFVPPDKLHLIAEFRSELAAASSRDPLLDTPVRDLDLSARAIHALEGVGIETFGGIISHPESFFHEIKNIGKKTVRDIIDVVREKGYVFDWVSEK